MNAEHLAAARTKAVAFVAAEQGASNHLPIRLFNPDRPDRTVFASCYAAMALSVDDSPRSVAIRRKLVDFIRKQREWPGRWRYWGRGSPVPCDLDCSALGQIVLGAHGVPSRRTDWLLHLHRRADGVFLAWMMPGNVSTWNPRYWATILTDLTPARLHFRFFGAWKTAGKSHSRQFHVVSNAHIVHYLGDTPRSAAAIDWIIDSVLAGRESEREIYYRDPEFLYLAIGRGYRSGIGRFSTLAETIEKRLEGRSLESGRIGTSAFTTAAACAALLHLDRRGPLVERAIRWLASIQADDGGWEAAPLDHDGPPPSVTGWGSRSLTTAVVIEALTLCLPSRRGDEDRKSPSHRLT